MKLEDLKIHPVLCSPCPLPFLSYYCIATPVFFSFATSSSFRVQSHPHFMCFFFSSYVACTGYLYIPHMQCIQ